jgi:hypothetical protein
MFQRSLDVASTLISCSSTEKSAETILEMFVKQVATDFAKVQDSIAVIKAQAKINELKEQGQAEEGS